MITARQSYTVAWITFFVCIFNACPGQQLGQGTEATAAFSAEVHLQATDSLVFVMSPCARALQNILAGDFADWRGLPPGCDWTALTGPLPEAWEVVAQRSLGSNFRTAKMIMLPIDGYYRPSLSFVEGEAVLFEGMRPALAMEDGKLIATLGQPEAVLEWDYGTLPCPESEFVYPERGITLFLRRDHARVLHVGLYAATTLEEYKKNIRPHLKKTRRPIR